jgi:hypothetical protein
VPISRRVLRDLMIDSGQASKDTAAFIGTNLRNRVTSGLAAVHQETGRLDFLMCSRSVSATCVNGHALLATRAFRDSLSGR